MRGIGNLIMIDFTKLSDIEIDGIDTSDYPDFCDAYILAAKQGKRSLTEEELEELNDDREFVYQKVVEKIF